MADYSKELDIAKEAANKAAELIRQFQREQSFEVNYKGLNDLVTDADVAVEEKILDIITAHFPDDQILAEESSEEKVQPVGRTWLIDPIDGTTNFVHGFPIYCVSIALWEDKSPKAGIVIEINSDDIFEAVEENGAFCNGKPIEVSSIAEAKHALISTGFPYNGTGLEARYFALFKNLLQHTQGVRRSGSAAYDLCCVAAGRIEGFYEYALKPWDVGAGSLIIQEAGGVISDWEESNNWLMGERIIAANTGIHPFLVEAVQEYFPAEELRT
jgi:myo-inositol-1(or 4)-monophosphatase